ncbi:glycosyltransferase family 4 protein [bacterium]|nr:glycosyltransferase family 4 protein [bacterium]
MMGSKKILVPSFDFKPLLGGVANYVHEVCLALKTEHHCEIEILARQLPGCQTYDQSSPFKIHRLTTPDTAFLALPKWTFEIQKIIKATKPDLIFCPLWFPDATAVYLAQKFLKTEIPYFIAVHAMEVVESHKNIKQILRKIALSSLKKKTFQNSTKIFPVSKYTNDLLNNHLQLSQQKTQVINNGVNLDIYKQIPQKPHLKKTLLTVSRIHSYKGMDRVLYAVSDLLKRGLQIEYKIIGTGIDLPRLKKIASDLKIEDSVIFLGPLSQNEIIDHYNQADLFVLLSREELPDVEGFGLVFLEAAACGLPSVGGQSGGIPDAIEDTKSGWLVDPIDQKRINSLLFDLLTHPEKLKHASEFCLNMVKNRTWKQTAHKIAETMNV